MCTSTEAIDPITVDRRLLLLVPDGGTDVARIGDL